MAKTGRVALAQTVFHNKESLVLIRSVKRGLVLHFLFFKDEIRDFDAIAKGDGVKVPAEQGAWHEPDRENVVGGLRA